MHLFLFTFSELRNSRIKQFKGLNKPKCLAVWLNQMVKCKILSLNKTLSYFSHIYILEGENPCLSRNNFLYGTLFFCIQTNKVLCAMWFDVISVIWCCNVRCRLSSYKWNTRLKLAHKEQQWDTTTILPSFLCCYHVHNRFQALEEGTKNKYGKHQQEE